MKQKDRNLGNREIPWGTEVSSSYLVSLKSQSPMSSGSRASLAGSLPSPLMTFVLAVRPAWNALLRNVYSQPFHVCVQSLFSKDPSGHSKISSPPRSDCVTDCISMWLVCPSASPLECQPHEDNTVYSICICLEQWVPGTKSVFNMLLSQGRWKNWCKNV